MPKGVDYGVMDAAMHKGEVAMVINGPWAWANLKTANINFGVAPIPSVAGQPSQVLRRRARRDHLQGLARTGRGGEFIENYLLSDEGLKMINDDVPLGAGRKACFAELKSDPNIAATLANAQDGVPMPSIPEMGKFWSAMGPALHNITKGRQSAEEALDAAAKRILAQ